MESKRPEDEVTVLINRDGEERNIKVRLAKNVTAQFMGGMNLRDLSAKNKKEFGIEKGVLVDAAGAYFEGQIEEGSLITSINGERIFSIEDLKKYSPRSVQWISYITPREKIRLRL